MKKIAIIITGHLRTFFYKKNSNLRLLLNNFESDIYIHTWDSIDMPESSWRSPEYAIKQEKNNIKKFLKSELRPKKILIENQQEIEVPPQIDKQCKPFYYMIYSINKALDLFNPYQYSHIIKLRFDLDVDKNFNFKKDIIKIKDEKKIVLARHNWAQPFKIYSDIYFIAKPKIFIKVINQNLVDLKSFKIKDDLFFPELFFNSVINNLHLRIYKSSNLLILQRKNKHHNQVFNPSPSIILLLKNYIEMLFFIFINKQKYPKILLLKRFLNIV